MTSNNKIVKNTTKRYDNNIKAQIIETWVNNPDILPKEMYDLFGVTLQTYSSLVSKWFSYKGDNPITITLSSKV